MLNILQVILVYYYFYICNCRESEDTMLLILKEIYGQMGIAPDSQVPQPILPFDISGDNDTYSEYTYSIGALPTQFVRK